jgi:hypothetical protein
MLLLAASTASLGLWKQLIKKKGSYERKLMVYATVYCHANKISLRYILLYVFWTEACPTGMYYCSKLPKWLNDDNLVSDIKKCTKCHGLWFWMLTEHNGLDRKQSSSFDKSNLQPKYHKGIRHNVNSSGLSELPSLSYGMLGFRSKRPIFHL